MAEAVDPMWYVQNFWHNLTHMFDDMNMTRWIRMVAVVGAYFLVRPYFIKIGENIQKKQFEKQAEADRQANPQSVSEVKAKISPNGIRGLESEKEETSGVDASWGGKAKARQRTTVKKRLEAQEKMLAEDDEELKIEDIKDMLVDYEEGVDGW